LDNNLETYSEVLGQFGWANSQTLNALTGRLSYLQILKLDFQILASHNDLSFYTYLEVLEHLGQLPNFKAYSGRTGNLQILKTDLQIICIRLVLISKF